MTNSPSFRSIKPPTIPAAAGAKETVRYRLLDEGCRLPQVIEPAGLHLVLADWAESNKERVTALLREHGALLFRGFEVSGQAGFQGFADAVGGGPLQYTQRSTRRSKVAEGVYTSTEYPAPLAIELHSENSFQQRWPQRIMFHSVTVAESGGATPIADNAEVFGAIDPSVREEFLARRIRYVRNFGGGLELSWQEAFQVDERAGAEAYFRANSIRWRWKDNDRLKTEQDLPAAICLPGGTPAWFNQVHLFHVSNLTPEIREALLESIPEDDLPRQAYFGDGGVIPDSYLENIRAAYKSGKYSFPWQRDDVMLLDNLRICHGREPFTGQRKVLVSMSDPASYDDFGIPAAAGRTPAGDGQQGGTACR